MTAAKLVAARELGLPVVLVRRPPLPAGVDVVPTVEEALAWVAALTLFDLDGTLVDSVAGHPRHHPGGRRRAGAAGADPRPAHRHGRPAAAGRVRRGARRRRRRRRPGRARLPGALHGRRDVRRSPSTPGWPTCWPSWATAASRWPSTTSKPAEFARADPRPRRAARGLRQRARRHPGRPGPAQAPGGRSGAGRAPATATQPVLVGDRAQDVVGARVHGLPCIGAGWGPARPGELAQAGAAVVVRHPGRGARPRWTACRALTRAGDHPSGDCAPGGRAADHLSDGTPGPHRRWSVAVELPVPGALVDVVVGAEVVTGQVAQRRVGQRRPRPAASTRPITEPLRLYWSTPEGVRTVLARVALRWPVAHRGALAGAAGRARPSAGNRRDAVRAPLRLRDAGHRAGIGRGVPRPHHRRQRGRPARPARGHRHGAVGGRVGRRRGC